MYEINDCVVYGSAGVCKIADKRIESFCGEKKEYYILNPVYGSESTIYVPCDNQVLLDKMKKLITVDDVHELISKMPDAEVLWIDNDRERNESFMEILKSSNYVKIVGLIKVLYMHKKKMEGEGKKFRAPDKKLLDLSEKVLYEEFAQALGIDPNQVLAFIKNELNENELNVSIDSEISDN